MRRDAFEDVFATQITFSVLNTRDPSLLFCKSSMRKENAEREEPVTTGAAFCWLPGVIVSLPSPKPFG